MRYTCLSLVVYFLNLFKKIKKTIMRGGWVCFKNNEFSPLSYTFCTWKLNKEIFATFSCLKMANPDDITKTVQQ